MPVRYELPRGEGGDREFHPVDHGVEPTLQQFDQVLRRIALAADRFVVIALELLLADIAVVALELLLGHQLHAEIGRLFAPLTVLAGAIFALGDRGFGPAPEIDTEAAIDFVLAFNALGHLARGPLRP